MSETFTFTEEQFQQIQSALNTAAGFALRHREMDLMNKFSVASMMMDDVANGFDGEDDE